MASPEAAASTGAKETKKENGTKDPLAAAGKAAETNGNGKTVDADAAPAGFVTQTDDLEAYWDPEECGPILFTPKHAKLFDSQIEPSKPSTLITCELEKAAVLISADTDKTAREYKPGTVFGIWAKPGMRPLKRLGGVVVYMKLKGEKATGKPNPMKTFDIMSRDSGNPLPIAEDKRDKSLPAALKQNKPVTESDREFSDIPF